MNKHWANLRPKDNSFNGEKVNFPVQFELKIIIESVNSTEHNIGLITGILQSFSIPYENISTQPSKTGKYISFTAKITVDNDRIFNNLYRELTSIPHLKMAI